MAAILNVYCVVKCSKIWHKTNNWFQESTRYSWRHNLPELTPTKHARMSRLWWW